MNTSVNKIYVVQLYEYDTYSFSGISRNTELYFSTKEKAMKWISDRDLKLVEYCKYPDFDITLHEEAVDEY